VGAAGARAGDGGCVRARRGAFRSPVEAQVDVQPDGQVLKDAQHVAQVLLQVGRDVLRLVRELVLLQQHVRHQRDQALLADVGRVARDGRELVAQRQDVGERQQRAGPVHVLHEDRRVPAEELDELDAVLRL
jgi:hypothetical protein